MSFIWKWFQSVLNYLGLAYKKATIMFIGLDNAGKSTLLYMLKENHMKTVRPTNHPTMEELTMGKIKFHAWDLGGHLQARSTWRKYFPAIDAIVFLVDANDRERFEEARKELSGLLKQDDLAKVPFLVLGNKVDLPTAVSEEELRAALGLELTTGKDNPNLDPNIRPIEVFMCSVLKKWGYGDGFRWLAKYL